MIPKSLLRKSACLVFSLLAASGPLKSQFTSGIEGVVLDPTDASVPNAEVTIRNVDTGEGRSTRTSTHGFFRFASLPAAVFDVRIEAPGFKPVLLEKIRVHAAETRNLSVKLELGAATEVVEVSAAPPPIELSEGRISGYVDEAKVKDLPLVGRNLYSLVVLTPGVTGLPSGGGQAYAQATADIFNAEFGVNLNSSGQRAEANNFIIDSSSVNAGPRGGVTNVTPNPESVQEVRVLVNNFSAEYGRNAGAITSVVSKQGTNDIHGSLAWFHTNNAISARNVFQRRVPVFRRNEGAWSLGGPIVKERTFAFASMDVLRSGVGIGRSAVVATPEFIDFLKQNRPNAISTFILDNFRPQFVPNRSFRSAGSLTNTPCTGSDPISTPVGTMPCDFRILGEGDFNTTLPRNGIQWNTRVDHNWNDYRDRLYGNIYRTTRQTVIFASPSIYFPHFSPIGPEYTMLANANWTHTVSPTVMNEMGAAYVRTFGDAPCDRCEIPSISVTGLTQGPGNGFVGAFIQNNYEWRDVLSMNRSPHTFKMGVNVIQTRATQNFTNNYLRPTYSFLNIFDFANDSPFTQGNIGFDPLTGGIALADITIWQTTVGAFIQDDWKVSRKLTLNLGIRWETFGNPREQNNRLTNMELGEGSTFFDRIAEGRVLLMPRLLAESDLNNWAPRFGFAWDPTGSGKLAIRGGVGIFYDRFSNQFWQNMRTNPPLFALATASVQTPPFTPIFALGTSGDPPFGFPRPPSIRTGLDSRNGLLAGKVAVAATDRQLRTQYGQNWSLGFQYALTPEWVAESYYIGSYGRKLYAAYEVNRFSGDLVENGRLDRLNTSFGSIVYGQSNFNSAYHGGTVSVRNRALRPFSVQAAYTFGKAVDQASTFGPGLTVVDVTNPRRERGLSDFDVRHRVSFSVLYQFPRWAVSSKAWDKLLNGWQVSNITILQSGTPFTVRCQQPFVAVRDANGNVIGNNGCDFNGDGLNFDMPMTPSFGNNISGVDRSDYLRGVFTSADFPRPPLGTQGDLGRNTFIGPGFANTDFSITKNTQIPWFTGQEGANLQFRAEFFNVFNRVNLGLVEGNTSGASFGKSTTTFPSRNIQFALRIAF